MENINLIPQEEVQQQVKTQLIKVSTVVAILLFIVVVALAGYLYYQTDSLNKRKESINSDITRLRSEISAQSGIEIGARNLSKKVDTLKDLMSNSPHYSLLVSELKSRQTPDIKLSSFDFLNDKINISGSASSYLALSGYIDNLLNRDGTKGTPELKTLFKTVSLNSVTLESNTGRVSFSLEVYFDTEKLKNK